MAAGTSKEVKAAAKLNDAKTVLAAAKYVLKTRTAEAKPYVAAVAKAQKVFDKAAAKVVALTPGQAAAPVTTEAAPAQQ